MREIPKKNYIIFSFIVILSVIICLYIVLLYNRTKHYYENNSILTEILNEIVLQEDFSVENNINNYLVENTNLIIYISSGKNKAIKNFEQEFKKMIIDENIKEDILYINSDNIDYISFMNDFLISYQIQNIEVDLNSLNESPTLISFKEGKINKIYISEEPSLIEMKCILIENGVISND